MSTPWLDTSWQSIRDDATNLNQDGPGSSDLVTADNIPDMYKVRLFGGGIDIEASIPQNFSLQLSSTWDDPYNKSFVEDGGSGGIVTNSGSPSISGSGNPTGILELGGLSWQAGAHMEFAIPFVFRATKNSKEEVLSKMKELLKLVAPNLDGNTLVKPDFKDDPLTLKVGTFLEISPVIVESISEEFDSIFDQEGTPIAVTINVNIKTLYTITDEAIDKMFITL